MESLPPPPPAEVIYHSEPVPELGDPVAVELASAAPPAESAPLTTVKVESTASEITTVPVTGLEATPNPNRNEERLTKLQKVRGKLAKIALGEGVGTAIDVATMAAGIPLPAREITGSTLDSMVYGEDGNSAEINPSRLRKVGKKVGSIALFAAAGMAAQKFGTEFADVVSDKLSEGVTGEYITPLGSKLAAIPGVNATIKRLSRS